MRDVIARLSVAACQTTPQLPIFVEQRDRHTVDLQFDDPFGRLAIEQLRDPRRIFPQVVHAVRVFDRQHRHAMIDLFQFGNRLIANPLRRTVGRNQLRMLSLE